MFSIPLYRNLTYVFNVRVVWVMVGEHPNRDQIGA
jgi:hypothetical protein